MRFGRRGEGSVGHLHIRVMEGEEATLVDGLEARGLAGAVAIQRLCVSVRVYVCMCIHVHAVCVCKYISHYLGIVHKGIGYIYSRSLQILHHILVYLNTAPLHGFVKVFHK